MPSQKQYPMFPEVSAVSFPPVFDSECSPFSLNASEGISAPVLPAFPTPSEAFREKGEHSESETGGKDTAETSENIGYRFCEGICSDFRERKRGY